jgi:4,5-DOPA dioxygenase extradiol
MSNTRMPALFIGHGTPMNALEQNDYTLVWRELAGSIPRPRAILAVSAHWSIQGTAVTAQANPKTLHDFGGFPPELFAIRYAARGDPPLALHVRDLLAPTAVTLDDTWGIDHGAWSVLVHLYPDADIPVVQLSVDASQPADVHYRLGRELSALRDEGVLLLASGNAVHNLRLMQRSASMVPFDWALEFNTHVRRAVLDREHDALIHYERAGRAAQLSVPTPEHYLPLLYVLGAQRNDESATILCDGIDLGSISMLSVKIGN